MALAPAARPPPRRWAPRSPPTSARAPSSRSVPAAKPATPETAAPARPVLDHGLRFVHVVRWRADRGRPRISEPGRGRDRRPLPPQAVRWHRCPGRHGHRDRWRRRHDARSTTSLITGVQSTSACRRSRSRWPDVGRVAWVGGTVLALGMIGCGVAGAATPNSDSCDTLVVGSVSHSELHKYHQVSARPNRGEGRRAGGHGSVPVTDPQPYTHTHAYAHTDSVTESYSHPHSYPNPNADPQPEARGRIP